MEEKRNITPLPKALPISGVILLILGIAFIPFVDDVFTEQQLMRNAILSGIPFILIFAALIIFLMSGIWYVSNKLNFRISNRTYSIIERITIGGIIVGIVFMFQPWLFVLFRYGFYLLLISTIAFITWSHIAAAEAAEDFPTDSGLKVNE